MTQQTDPDPLKPVTEAEKPETDSSSNEPFSPTRPCSCGRGQVSVGPTPKTPASVTIKTRRSVGVLEYTTTFLGVSDNRDRIMKFLGYVLRLLMWYRVPDRGVCMMGATNADEAIARMKNVEGSLIDCRMLLNHFKYVHSVQAILSTLQDKGLHTLEWYVMVLRNMLWTQEVIASDANYMVKHIFRDVDPARPGWHYKFGKSTQLTLLFCVESLRLLRILRAARERGHTTGHERNQILLKSLTLVRCVCDCIIYYTWIDAYKPDKGLQYICGLISSICALYTGIRGHYHTLSVVRTQV
eukprot:Hpha_TRINITY_DN14737_c0_g1::TRINITY_DN14737_c0_g1_i1::g.102692::m.102692